MKERKNQEIFANKGTGDKSPGINEGMSGGVRPEMGKGMEEKKYIDDRPSKQ